MTSAAPTLEHLNEDGASAPSAKVARHRQVHSKHVDSGARRKSTDVETHQRQPAASPGAMERNR